MFILPHFKAFISYLCTTVHAVTRSIAVRRAIKIVLRKALIYTSIKSFFSHYEISVIRLKCFRTFGNLQMLTI